MGDPYASLLAFANQYGGTKKHKYAAPSVYDYAKHFNLDLGHADLNAIHKQSQVNQIIEAAKHTKNPIEQLQSESFKKLDPETQDRIFNAVAADAEAKQLGAERKKRKKWYNRVLDVASRGFYATAEGAKEGFDRTVENEGKHTIDDTVKGFFHGAKEGFTGKKKTSFSDTIQHVADVKHAREHGRTLKDTEEGEAKVNPWLKYGGGLAADIFLDPTTYLGVGAVAKVPHILKGAQAIEHLEKGAKTVQDLNRAGMGLRDAETIKNVRESMKYAPIKPLKRKEVAALSPQAKQLYEEALTHQYDKGMILRNTYSRKKAKKSAVGNPQLRAALLSEGKIDAAAKAAVATVHAVEKENVLDDLVTKGALSPGSADAIRGMAPRVGARAGLDQEKAGRVVDALKTHSVSGPKKTLTVNRDVLKGVLEKHEIKGLEEAGVLKSTEKAGVLKVAQGLDKEGRISDGAMYRALMKGEKGAAVKATKEERALVQAAKNEALKKKGFEFALKGAGEGGGAIRDLTDRTISLVTHNLDDTAKKRAYLTAMGKPVVPLAPKFASHGASRVNRALHSSNRYHASVEGFQKRFVAKAGVLPGMDFLRKRNLANFMNEIHANGYRLQKIWDKIPTAMREEVTKSYKAGALEGNTVKGGVDIFKDGKAPVNIMQHIDEDVKSLDTVMNVNSISSRELDDYLSSAFKTNGKTIEEALKDNPRITDAARALYLYDAAVKQVIARRAMLSEAGEQFGVRITDDAAKIGANRTTDMLKKQGWREVELRNSPPELKGVLFAPDHAKSLEKLDLLFHNREALEGLERVFNKANGYFKSSVTIYNPSFHVRTLLGEVMLGYLGGMKSMTRSYGWASRVMRSRDRELFNGMPVEGLSRRDIRQANILEYGKHSAEAATESNAKKILKINVKGSDGKNIRLSMDQVWHYFMTSGVKTGFASQDLVREGVSRAALGKGATAISRKVHAGAENVEDFGRLAHFIDVLQHSKANTVDDLVAEASQTVTKYHLDYAGGVTPFEQRVAGVAIPFYKWIRLSTPMMLNVLLTKPGKALALPKFMSALSGVAGYRAPETGILPSGPDAIVPWYMQSAYPLFGQGGGSSHYYFNPQAIFPLQSSIDTADDESGPEGALWQRLSPLATYPASWFLNEGTYDKDPRSHPGKFFSGIIPQSKLAYLLAHPTDPNITPKERLLLALLNPGLVENTPKKMSNEAFRDEQAAYKNRKKREQELGLR